MMKFSTISVAALSVTMIGCKGSGQPDLSNIPPRKEAAPIAQVADKDLFPFKEGNEWTYTSQMRLITQKTGDQVQNPLDVKFKIEKVDESGDTKTVHWVITIGDKIVDKQQWIQNSKGVYQLGLGYPNYQTFSEPQPIILFPVKTGTKFTWHGNGPLTNGKPGVSQVKSEILAVDNVETGEGNMSAIPVESKQEFKSADFSGSGIATTYIVPKIGMVRFKQQEISNANAAIQLMKLTSHKFN